MARSRNVGLVGGIVVAAVVVLVGAGSLYWRAKSGGLDEMRDAVAAFQPPAEWVGWTMVDVTEQGYSPFCVDVECPSYAGRHVVAVPDGDVGRSLEASIEQMGVGMVTAPERQCVAGARCLFTVDGDGFTLDIVLSDPFEFERGTVTQIPSGFVEVTVNLHAY